MGDGASQRFFCLGVHYGVVSLLKCSGPYRLLSMIGNFRQRLIPLIRRLRCFVKVCSGLIYLPLKGIRCFARFVYGDGMGRNIVGTFFNSIVVGGFGLASF